MIMIIIISAHFDMCNIPGGKVTYPYTGMIHTPGRYPPPPKASGKVECYFSIEMPADKCVRIVLTL